MLLYVTNEVFHELLGEIHVAVQVAERDFGFDHPKLGSVARGVGVFGPEGRTKGINIAQGTGKNLGFELTADSEEGRLGKEVLGVINFAFRRQRWLLLIEGGNAKHLAGTFAVARCDDWRVHIMKFLILEKLVDRVGEAAAHAEDGAEQIGAGPQVSDFTQELQRVPFLLQRIGGVSFAKHGKRFRDDFPLLTAAFGLNKFAANLDRGTGIGAFDIGVIGQRGIDDDLHAFKAGAVVEFDKGKDLGVTAGAHPTLEQDGVVRFGGVVGEFDEGALHLLRNEAKGRH